MLRQLVATVLIALLVISPVLANPPAEKRKLDVDGTSGIWFPMTSAKNMLADLAQLPEVKLQLKLIERRLELEKQRSALLVTQAADTQKIADIWKKTAESQAKRVSAASPWYSSPYLWTAIGFIVGAGTTVGIAVAVRKTGAVQ